MRPFERSMFPEAPLVHLRQLRREYADEVKLALGEAGYQQLETLAALAASRARNPRQPGRNKKCGALLSGVRRTSISNFNC